MRPVATLAFAGISGVVLWKLFATILLPLLGVLFGLFASLLKFAAIAGVIFFVYSLIRKRREEAEA